MKKSIRHYPCSVYHVEQGRELQRTGNAEIHNLADRSGAQSLSFCGSTGENITQTMEEQKMILEKCIRFVDGQPRFMQALVVTVRRRQSN